MAPLKDPTSLDRIQQEVWSARLPLEIRLSPSESRLYDKTEPYLVCAIESTKLTSFPSWKHLPNSYAIVGLITHARSLGLCCTSELPPYPPAESPNLLRRLSDR